MGWGMLKKTVRNFLLGEDKRRILRLSTAARLSADVSCQRGQIPERNPDVSLQNQIPFTSLSFLLDLWSMVNGDPTGPGKLPEDWNIFDISLKNRATYFSFSLRTLALFHLRALNDRQKRWWTDGTASLTPLMPNTEQRSPGWCFPASSALICIYVSSLGCTGSAVLGYFSIRITRWLWQLQTLPDWTPAV